MAKQPAAPSNTAHCTNIDINFIMEILNLALTTVCV